MVTFRVLGSLEADDGARRVDLRGPRHRAVLARLLVARGRVVPVRWLVDDLWDEPPEGARGAVQTFVGALRKALEPDRPARTPSRLLVTSPPGYVLRAAATDVDAWRAEAALARAGELLAHGDAPAALHALDDVLAAWRGGAYAEFAELDWARAEAARIDDLRLVALERRAEAALALGRPEAAAADLDAHVRAHPTREDAWWLLASALYAAGRQADALAALRRAQETLRERTGLDPGPRLRRLHEDVLAQAPHLLRDRPGPVAHPVVVVRETPGAAGSDGADPHPFVGRDPELAVLDAAAAEVVAGARPGLVLVSGVAGAGKSSLARRFAADRARTGWTTTWAESPEARGAADDPWSRVVRELADPERAAVPPPPEGPDDPVTRRRDRHAAVLGALAASSSRGPVLVVLDDLQWADEETLTLLVAATRGAPAPPAAGPVLVVGTFRSTEVSAELAAALAQLARAEPARVHLGGLDPDDVGALARALSGGALRPAAVRAIHDRTGGNPFFVRELVRVWEADGEAALGRVPTGVRDVIRHRLARLPQAAQTHLRRAADAGPEVDVDTLLALDGDEDAVLDALDAALLAGFLVEVGDDRLRFAHALVREALVEDVPRSRRAAWHAAVAQHLAATRPEDVEAVTHHVLRAGSRVPAAEVARWTRAAAERAERRTAPREAARLWRESLTALDRSPTGDPRVRLETLMGRVRTLAVTGRLDEARTHRAEAVDAAVRLGDPALTAAVLGSFDVPAVWPANDDPALSARLADIAERTLVALPATDDAARARLLVTIAMERRADPGPRGAQAAREAERLARRLDDPLLVALALDARFLHTVDRAGLARERARLGHDLLDVAGDSPDLATFAVLGHLVLVQASAALADLAAADHHAAAVDALAERYDLPLVTPLTGWYAALRLAVEGRTDDARTAYRAAAAGLVGTGMTGLERGALPFALLSLDPALRVPPGLGPDDFGPYAPWVRPLVLLADGDVTSARDAVRALPEPPRDLLREARLCLQGHAAVATGDLVAAELVHAALLPAAHELAGAGSGLVALGPVALHLGRLAAFLGRPAQAAEHHRLALVVADRVGAPHWAAAARAALDGLDAEGAARE
ncbi:BTAD domain-containing putative transcriptional regulator [Cellulomonas sp. NS3]|uniref:BTAD domain-containing putative transcriptional regulator n=1 Tax=Cellulomonas sp. NS3 TaxID=2973977 RepID=UPI002163B3F6|nr:BTAD domain-containing putative transcriptional regulator [Cellulomonas sp. NS3]